MQRVEQIISRPEARDKIAEFKELLTDNHLDNHEIREILLYRTFYYFLEQLNAQRETVSGTKLSNDIVRLFADRFDWIKAEVALTRQFGSRQIDYVFRYAYGEPNKSLQSTEHTNINRQKKHIYPLFWLLSVLLLLAFLIIFGLENYTRLTAGSDVPYYACKILFSKNAKQKNYSDCESMAKAGDSKAQLLFGLAQLYSRNFAKKPDAAIDWLTKSANQSNSKAMYMLGALHGEDLKSNNKTLLRADFDSASYWLDRAGHAGEKYAYTHLASLYVIRGDSDDNLRTAREKLLVAANSEQPDAYYAMALFELYGLVSNVDYELARKWLDLYARNSVPGGSNNAAWLLATSPDSNFRDPAQAAQYLDLLLKDRKDPNLYMYLDTVAAVDAANGKFDAAVDFQEQAINLLKRQDKAVYRENIAGFQKRLSLYKDRRAWTEDLPDNYVQLSFEGIKNRIFSRELTEVVLKTH